MLRTGEYQARAARLGDRLRERLTDLVQRGDANAVRVHGLWAGVDVADPAVPARRVCEQLLERGVLAKEAHEHTIRLAPPIVISEDDLDLATARLTDALAVASRVTVVA
jgi:ornithine--oxo-acid transaminase